MRRALACLPILLSGFCSATYASNVSWELDGKLHTGVWSSNRSLENVEGVFPATLGLQSKLNLTDNMLVYADGRAGDSTYFGGSSYAVLREFYLNYSFKNADIRLGKQLLPWGRADRINPTDSLTSRDYRWLAPEEEDLRFGNTGIRYAHYLGDYTVTGVWLPYMRTTRIPISSDFVQHVAIDQPDNIDNFGFKIDYTGTGVDGALSYYRGNDTMPSLELKNASIYQPYALVNYQIQRFGSDAAWAVGAYTLRTELAYTSTGKLNNQFSGRKANYFQGVVGLEKQFANNLNVILQGVWQSAFDWRSPSSWPSPEQNQLAVFQQVINQQPVKGYGGIAYRVSKKWFNDSLEFELSGMDLSANQGWVTRPRLRYQVNDDLSLALGGDYFNGSINTIFGRLHDNSTVFLELTYAFGTRLKL